MGKVCIRCGYERKEVESTPASECPSCGVIYERAEAQRVTSQQSQIRLAGMLKRKQSFEADRSIAGFFTFGWMITPRLIQGVFLLALLILLIGFVNALTSGSFAVAVGALAGIVVMRLVLEAFMVIFRLAEDVREVRALLTDQAVEDLRQRT